MAAAARAGRARRRTAAGGAIARRRVHPRLPGRGGRAARARRHARRADRATAPTSSTASSARTSPPSAPRSREAAELYPGGEELLAAKIVGRWRDGTPLDLSPDAPTRRSSPTSTATTPSRYADDADGLRCPIGAHIRRANPRDGLPFEGQLVNRHRLIRRGIPYGDPLPPGADDDGADRGVIFMCLQASIARQFEFVQSQWLNDGNAFAPRRRPGRPARRAGRDAAAEDDDPGRAAVPARAARARRHARAAASTSSCPASTACASSRPPPEEAPHEPAPGRESPGAGHARAAQVATAPKPSKE